MFIEEVRIQGYKSLGDITLTDLGPINVFHGYNDVGKSNILEALDLFFQLLPLALDIETEWEGLTDYDLEPYVPDEIFRVQGQDIHSVIQWDVRLRPSETAKSFEVRMCLERKDTPSRARRALVALPDREKPPETLDISLSWPSGPPDPATQQQLRAEHAGFNLLSARRRFQVEYLEEEAREAGRRTRRPEVTAQNLKRAMFDAYASLDLDERARFEALQALLDDHFRVGRLDVGLERPTSEAQLAGRKIVVRFLRPELGKKAAIEMHNVGSGVRQVLLLLGQVLFNPARIVGIEEPEMNLSHQWQLGVMNVLQDMITPDPGGLDQLFIASHALRFETEPEVAGLKYFYDVTYHEGATQVRRRQLENREKYFPALPTPIHVGEELGPYLNSLNQVKVPQRVIEDLGLQPREPVFFYKTPEGYWRLRTKDELLDLMAAMEEGENDDSHSAGY